MLVFGKVHEDVIQSPKNCFPNTLWYSVRLVAQQNLWNFWNFEKYHYFRVFHRKVMCSMSKCTVGELQTLLWLTNMWLPMSLCAPTSLVKICPWQSHIEEWLMHTQGILGIHYIHGVCIIHGYTTWQVLNPQVVAHLFINSLRKNMPILWLNQPRLGRTPKSTRSFSPCFLHVLIYVL